MQPIATPRLQSLLLACAIALAFPAIAADTTTTSDTTTTTTTSAATIGTSATTEAKLAAEFADFLGGETQAKSVVSGLRQGTSFSADAESSTGSSSTTSPTTTAGTSTGTTTGSAADATTSTGTTGTMGYGEVRMTLRLAQAQLEQMGITQPTDAELAAVLQGGEVGGTQVDGILALRADGMGWGQIAQKSGMTVGQLMGKAPIKTTASTTAGATKTDTGSTPRAASATRSNGYIPSSSKAGTTHVRSNGYIPSGKSAGAGIVSGAGDRMAAASSLNRGQTHKAGASVQNGGGSASAGGRLVSMGGGSRAGGPSAAPGQARKN